MAGFTDEKHIRDAQRAQNRLLRLLYDIGAFSLPDDQNVSAQVEGLLDEMDTHTDAIRVKGDAARNAKAQAGERPETEDINVVDRPG